MYGIYARFRGHISYTYECMTSRRLTLKAHLRHKGVCFVGLLALLLARVAPATTLEHGPSSEVQPEASADKIEVGRLRVENKPNGLIQGSRDGGKTWELIGHALTATTQVNRRGFTASKYGPVATIVATAVNAIHLKAGQNTAEDRGIIWSLAPQSDSQAGRASLQSEISPGSFVQTDIPGGSGIFGGPFTPFVGNPILLERSGSAPASLPANYVPKVGDAWTVLILRPKKYPQEIIFENRFGGLITIHYRGEEPHVIGTVLRPVLGVGRFVGSYFSDIGRLRANHNGVIDVSTSPRGLIGSFQIVPANHAQSPEVHYIRELTQWMVVGPVSALDPSWEGVAPLYSGFLRPRYDQDADWNSPDVLDLVGRFRFEVKMRRKDGTISDWQPMPSLWMKPNTALPTAAATALQDMTQLRIVFPFVFSEPPVRSVQPSAVSSQSQSVTTALSTTSTSVMAAPASR